MLNLRQIPIWPLCSFSKDYILEENVRNYPGADLVQGSLQSVIYDSHQGLLWTMSFMVLWILYSVKYDNNTFFVHEKLEVQKSLGRIQGHEIVGWTRIQKQKQKPKNPETLDD